MLDILNRSERDRLGEPAPVRVRGASPVSGGGSMADTSPDKDAPDRVVFDIAGRGPHIIEVDTELPAITEPVVLDGFSQPGASPARAASIGEGFGIVLDGHLTELGAHGLTVNGGGT